MKLLLSSGRHQYVAKASIFLITLALIAGMVGCDGYTLPPSEDLEIHDWYDLDAVRDNLSGHHILMNDLDSTTPGYTELASPTANQGKGWQPIGTFDPVHGVAGRTSFRGTFDGQGHEIRDLFINRPNEGRVGLFGVVVGVIKNIGAVNVTVIGDYHVGGLVGSGETVSNSYSTGSVSGNDRVGGLVGWNIDTVSDSYSAASVSGNNYVGGLVGKSQRTVSNSHSTGNVIGYEYVGGLVGGHYGTVSNSHSTGSVSGYEYVGGLVGNIAYGGTDDSVSNSYSTGSVSGYSDVGGLVGWNFKGRVSNSYSTGNVTGENGVGGLVGLNDDGTVSDSFWDTETSGQATSDGGTGKNTTEMQDITTFSGVGWNICAVAPGSTNTTCTWNIVDNVTYPFLSWQA